MTLESRIEELEKVTKHLGIALTHACLLVDQNMTLNLNLLERVEGLTSSEEAGDMIDEHSEVCENLQTHFEGLHKELEDGE